MDLDRLKEMERAFLDRYPGGFANAEIEVIAKKHRKGKMEAEAQEAFGADRFDNAAAVCDRFARLLGKSTVISLFEKPRLREAVAGFAPPEQAGFAEAIRERLHGDGERGFARMVEILAPHGIAKWPVITVLPAYFRPQAEVFVKPSTTKGVVQAMGLDLTYKPRPSWEFYAGYRNAILAMIAEVDPSLSPSTLAFGGFLMMSLGEA